MAASHFAVVLRPTSLPAQTGWLVGCSVDENADEEIVRKEKEKESWCETAKGGGGAAGRQKTEDFTHVRRARTLNSTTHAVGASGTKNGGSTQYHAVHNATQRGDRGGA